MGGEVPGAAGLSEESNEERKAAKKGFFPSSMGLSFLVPEATRAAEVTVRWGDYERVEVEGSEERLFCSSSGWWRGAFRHLRGHGRRLREDAVTDSGPVRRARDEGGLEEGWRGARVSCFLVG